MLFSLVVMMAGCSLGPKKGQLDSSSTADTAESDSGEVPGGSLRGTLVYQDGSPVSGVMMTLCSTYCITDDTDDSGEFWFADATAGIHVLENAVLGGDDAAALGERYPRVYDFFEIGSGSDVVLEQPMVLREVVDPLAPLLGPQDLFFDGGLRVQFDADLVGAEGNPLPYPAERVSLGAVMRPADEWPIRGLKGWTVLAVWSLAMWDMKLADGFQVSVQLDEALEAEAEVAFLVADYTHGFMTGEFFEETAILSEDGRTVSTLDGIDRTTMWMAVTR